MKITTQQAKTEEILPYLEYVMSLDARAYFMVNQIARPAINIFLNRNVRTMYVCMYV